MSREQDLDDVKFEKLHHKRKLDSPAKKRKNGIHRRGNKRNRFTEFKGMSR